MPHLRCRRTKIYYTTTLFPPWGARSSFMSSKKRLQHKPARHTNGKRCCRLPLTWGSDTFRDNFYNLDLNARILWIMMAKMILLIDWMILFIFCSIWFRLFRLHDCWPMFAIVMFRLGNIERFDLIFKIIPENITGIWSFDLSKTQLGW